MAIVSKNKKSCLFLKTEYKTMLEKKYNKNNVHFDKKQRNKIALSYLPIKLPLIKCTSYSNESSRQKLSSTHAPRNTLSS